jgi:predicted transcriptional regulator
MKTVSLKIDDGIFEEMEEIRSKRMRPRNRYINDALSYYNKLQKRLILEKTLREESEACKKSSMETLKEFELIDRYDF